LSSDLRNQLGPAGDGGRFGASSGFENACNYDDSG